MRSKSLSIKLKTKTYLFVLGLSRDVHIINETGNRFVTDLVTIYISVKSKQLGGTVITSSTVIMFSWLLKCLKSI